MPTLTAIALENLLEPRLHVSLKKSDQTRTGRPSHLYTSSSLYATPERRGGGHAGVPESRRGTDEIEGFDVDEVADNFFSEAEDEGSLDPRSKLDAADLSQIQIESGSFVSAKGEFFDAIDDFSSDGSISNTPSNEHRLSELHASKLNLSEEIDKRKTAEEAVLLMRSQWDKIRIVMSEAGLSFPAPPAISDGMQVEDQVLDRISQEVVAARLVAEAVGRGIARAEAEEAASAVIELKDQEILRLRDRLQYYETVNHEMSQRKLVEVARRQQERKSRRRRIWCVLGIGMSIVASLAAYSYIPPAESGEASGGSSELR